MNLELRHYRLFAAVAESGSFSAAARELGMSQPSVSRGVAVIERRLGVRLIVRTTRSFVLTPAGQTLHAEATTVLEADQAAMARTVRAGKPERVVLAVKPDSADQFLDEVLRRCTDLPSPIAVELRFAETHLLPALVRRGEADACLVAWPVNESGLRSRELWREPRVAVLANGHPFADGRRLTIEDFADEPVAIWPELPDDLNAYYQARDSKSAASAHGPAVSGLDQVLRLVELGRAVTFLPASVASRFRRQGLITVPVSDLEPSRMYLAWHAVAGQASLSRFIAVCMQDGSTGGAAGLW